MNSTEIGKTGRDLKNLKESQHVIIKSNALGFGNWLWNIVRGCLEGPKKPSWYRLVQLVQWRHHIITKPDEISHWIHSHLPGLKNPISKANKLRLRLFHYHKSWANSCILFICNHFDVSLSAYWRSKVVTIAYSAYHTLFLVNIAYVCTCLFQHR